MLQRLKALWSVDSRLGSFRQIIRESFTGAWQRNVEVDTRENVLRFSAVYSCVSGISGDIAKLDLRIMREDGEIMVPQKSGRYADLLKKPNNYQTRFQFVMCWVLAKLLTGNTYVLKQRDRDGRIAALHVLDSEFVTVLVSDSGDVYYQIKRDALTQSVDITVPASEIIHDRHVTLYHPLVGISPIYACGMSATLGNAILQTGAGFFKNKATPGGILTAPGRINDDTAQRLQSYWQENYTGANAGKIAVLGDNLKFERMTVTAVDAQLIDQLKFSIEDVARCYRYPLYKLQAGPPLMAGSAEEFNLQYYGDSLQPLIESAESVMNAGLELPSTLHVEFDLSGLSRMNTESQYRTINEGVRGGILARNEGRARLNLPPKPGGDDLMAQQQDYTLPDLAALRARERLQAEAPAPQPEQAAEEQTRALLDGLRKGLLQ
jgi:HK97 family phage portal protein